MTQFVNSRAEGAAISCPQSHPDYSYLIGDVVMRLDLASAAKEPTDVPGRIAQVMGVENGQLHLRTMTHEDIRLLPDKVRGTHFPKSFN